MFVLGLLSQRKITQHRGRRCVAASSIKERKTFISIQCCRGLHTWSEIKSALLWNKAVFMRRETPRESCGSSINTEWQLTFNLLLWNLIDTLAYLIYHFKRALDKGAEDITLQDYFMENKTCCSPVVKNNFIRIKVTSLLCTKVLV